MIRAARQSLGKALTVTTALVLAIVALVGGWLLGWILPGRR